MELPSINPHQKVYTLPAGDGYSCWGFDNAFEETQALAKCLRHPELAPTPEEHGTLAVLDKHRALVAAIPAEGIAWYNPRTPEKVRRVLERARREGLTLRLFLGDATTGRDWLEENDVVGRVGRSTGKLKIPLLVPEGDVGGPGILDANVVRILDADTGEELYRHPSYHQPELHLSEEPGADLPFVVKSDTDLARFKTLGRAAKWLAFITGEIHSQG